MHINTNINLPKSVRFRRWSRKGYAVFRSLSCCVTIGSVCMSICDMSLRKSNIISLKKVSDGFGENESDEDERDCEEQIAKQAQLEHILETYVPVYAQPVFPIILFINCMTVETSISCFNRFLFK